MNRFVLASAAALAASAGAASAGGLQPPIQQLATVQSFVAPTNCPAVQPVVSALQAQGFTRIEVDTGLTQARFAAMRGNEMNTFVYDCASGALLGQNAGIMSAAFEPGVVMTGDENDSDFVDVANAGADVGAGAEIGLTTDADMVADAGGGTEDGADAGAGVDAGAGADAGIGGDTPVSSDGSVAVGAGADASAGTGGSVSGEIDAGGAVVGSY